MASSSRDRLVAAPRRGALGAAEVVGLLTTLALFGCVSKPNFEESFCSAAQECPSGFSCGSDALCHAQTEDAGLRESTSSAQARSASGAPCASKGEGRINVALVNHCRFAVSTYAVGPDCSENPFSTIQVGESGAGDTYLNASWVVRDAKTQHLIDVLPPLTESGTITLCRSLLHHWAFEGDGRDSAGNADAAFQGGAVLDGHGVRLDGVTGHVSVPIASTLAALDSMTIEVWATRTSTRGQTWARLFDFGNSAAGSYMFFTPQRGSATPNAALPAGPRFAMTLMGNQGESRVEPISPFPVGALTHLAVTIDSRARTAAVYIDGVAVGRNPFFQLTPALVGAVTNNWLGRSQYPADPYFRGTISDVRIYGDAFSASDVAKSFGAGPDRVPRL